MKRAIIGAGALVVFGAMAVPSQALAGKTSSVLAIVEINDEAENFDYVGVIQSDKAKCYVGRKITVFREEGAQDEKLGSTKSFKAVDSDHGGWSVDDKPGGTGSYYAKAKETSKCKKSVSDPYSFPDRRARGSKAPAEITIDVLETGETWVYTGSITSPKPKCQNRKITVYRIKPGKDGKIGSGNSFPNFINPDDPAYYWEVEDFVEPNGEYYALAEATNKCKKAKSQVIGVSPR